MPVVPLAEPPPQPSSADFARETSQAQEAPKTQAAAEPIDWANLPIEELRARANAEESSAMEELARRLLQGVGVAKDDAQAADWYQKAAKQGYAPAQTNLGQFYAAGRGVPKDFAQALMWFKAAANQGNTTAQVNMGVMYERGFGVAADREAAITWYRVASDHGSTVAQANLYRLLASKVVH